ncbi:class I SAM-dependent methyltransferase [Micromonospora sp. NPDC003776]
MFGPEYLEVYEVTHSNRGKSWHDEAIDIASQIRQRRPDASSLLDVACGGGLHLQTFAAEFDRVAGVEPGPDMRRLAQHRMPTVPLHDADMRDFRLDTTFDAVTCLFVAINCLETVADLRAAVSSMAHHLTPGGVLVVEPWWFPERFLDGYVGGDLVREDGRTIARVSRSTRQGRATRMEERWLIGDDSGIREVSQVTMLTMFTRAEYEDAFAGAGCSVQYEEGWLTGRGLFVGVRTG